MSRGGDPEAGASVDVPDCLIWIIDGDSASEILGCDLDPDGQLQASFLDSSSNGFSEPSGQTCLDALAASSSAGQMVTGSVSVRLRGDGTVGGAEDDPEHLIWIVNGAGASEAIGCNLDDDGKLVTAFVDNSETGYQAPANGDSCAQTLAARRGEGATLIGPVAVRLSRDLMVFDVGKPSATD